MASRSEMEIITTPRKAKTDGFEKIHRIVETLKGKSNASTGSPEKSKKESKRGLSRSTKVGKYETIKHPNKMPGRFQEVISGPPPFNDDFIKLYSSSSSAEEKEDSDVEYGQRRKLKRKKRCSTVLNFRLRQFIDQRVSDDESVGVGSTSESAEDIPDGQMSQSQEDRLGRSAAVPTTRIKFSVKSTRPGSLPQPTEKPTYLDEYRSRVTWQRPKSQETVDIEDDDDKQQCDVLVIE